MESLRDPGFPSARERCCTYKLHVLIFVGYEFDYAGFKQSTLPEPIQASEDTGSHTATCSVTQGGPLLRKKTE